MTLIKQQIEIQLSKIKLLLMLVGSLTFVGIGLWFVISQPTLHRYSRTITPAELFIIGGEGIIFFGLCALVAIRKLADNRPGLIINDIGLTDNSSGVSGGQILWSDITDISILKMHRQKFIMLHVKNQQEYINRQTTKFKRKVMEINFNKFGSPLSISSNSLKI